MTCSGGTINHTNKSTGILLCEEYSEERSGRAVSFQEAQLLMKPGESPRLWEER